MVGCTEQIAEGLVYIHGKQRPHLDLKSENVLLARSADTVGGFVCKLADFGMVYDPSVKGQMYGTPEYMPHECYQPRIGELGAEPGLASDIFSCALMLWEMVARSRIYHSFRGFEDDDEAPSTIGKNGNRSVDVSLIAERLKQGERPGRSAGCPEVLYTLMRACWEHEIEDRPTAADLLSVIQKIREVSAEQPEILDPPEDTGDEQPPISYGAFLEQLSLSHKEHELADYLSEKDKLAELQQMDEDDLNGDILDEDELCFSEEQKAQFRAAVAALPYGLPADPYNTFLVQLGLTKSKADLSAFLSKPGDEMRELMQMDERKLDGDILDNEGLGLSEQTKSKFREAVAALRTTAAAVGSSRRAAWSELAERFALVGETVSPEVLALREQLKEQGVALGASRLREEEKEKELDASRLREEALRKEKEEKDEELAALRRQLQSMAGGSDK
jgi:hypothetical protein